MELIHEIYNKDKIIADILHNFAKRASIGHIKYGTTMERDDLKLIDWINHLQEELMDAIIYLTKIKTIIQQ